MNPVIVTNKVNKNRKNVVIGQFSLFAGILSLILSGIFTYHPLAALGLGTRWFDFTEGFFLGLAIPLLLLSGVLNLRLLIQKNRGEV